MRLWNWLKRLFKNDNPTKVTIPEKNPIDAAIEAGPKPIDPIGSGAKKEIADFKFVDSSHHHPKFDVEEYAKVCKLFINKCTQGTSFIDSTHTKRQKLCKDNGVLYGAYHFYECSKDCKPQWDHYAKTHGEFVIPPILDYELSGGNTIMELKANIENAYLWLCEAERVSGKTPILYIGYSLAKELKLPAKFKRFAPWIPRYASAFGSVPSPWTEVDMFAWQYTESGAFAGMGASNDVNLYYGKVNALNLE